MLTSLDIFNLRNFHYQSVVFKPGINIISGDNGVGKSSILEAIYHLATGKSFRTQHIKKLVRYGEEQFSVRGILSSGTSLAIQKHLSKAAVVKINDELVRSASELARYFPVQIIYEDIFNIIDCGPAIRRAFLDWGLFHVEHSYQSLFLDYKKALLNRNKLLKSHCKDFALLEIWESAMSNYGLALHALREKYMAELLPVFKDILVKLNCNLDINIQYHHGWGQSINELSNQTLLGALTEARLRDVELGYSTKGSHRADLKIQLESHMVKDALSRGQQKLVLLALKLAQGKVLTKACLFLFDDLVAELDKPTLVAVCNYLAELNQQVIITCLDQDNDILKEVSDNWFHVKPVILN